MPELNDSEYAVTTDCLRIVRDQYKEAGHPTPNIESALAKLTEGVAPWTNGMRFELIQNQVRIVSTEDRLAEMEAELNRIS